MHRLAIATVSMLVAGALAAGAPAVGQTPTPEPTATTPEPTATVEPGVVTLEVAPRRIRVGEAVVASGTISPAAEGERVDIVDLEGKLYATATTKPDGSYRVRARPRRNAELYARWLIALSDPATVRVRPVLTTGLAAVRLFGRGVARGRVRPAHPGGSVTVRLFRNGRPAGRKRAGLSDGLHYKTRFKIRRPGTYRVRASFDDDDHLPARARSARRTPALPALRPGSRGVRVKLLERRLKDLGYYLTGIDRRYDHRTRDAVIAFNKVQLRARRGTIDEATWRALAEPRKPRARHDGRGFHIEIDQTKQVIYLVDGGRVTWVVHTSTGAGGATRDGVYNVFRKLAGYSPNRLYYPSYFDGLRAIHGWPEVPTYPASHGCARVPMWAATWIYGKAGLGTQIRIYH